MKTSDMIWELCNKKGISASELARRIGQSPQNFGKKLRWDTVTLDEMIEIAKAVGVTYEQAFVLSLIAEGKVKDGVFMDDVYFNSTSTAAACIIGGSANGNIMWISPDGKTIKELKQQGDK